MTDVAYDKFGGHQLRRVPFTGQRYPKGHFNVENVRLLLLLVDATDDLPIESWSEDQIEQAGDWAVRSHLRASDNLNRVPERPSFIPVRPLNSGAGTGTVMDL